MVNSARVSKLVARPCGASCHDASNCNLLSSLALDDTARQTASSSLDHMCKSIASPLIVISEEEAV